MPVVTFEGAKIWTFDEIMGSMNGFFSALLILEWWYIFTIIEDNYSHYSRERKKKNTDPINRVFPKSILAIYYAEKFSCFSNFP